VAKEILTRMKALDINVHLDDFGTGYSSLGYILELPLDGIKIDRLFIRNITKVHRNLEVVKTILSLAENLELNVIAEGIETESQLELLKELDCQFGQGFLYAPPLPAGDAENLLKEYIQ